MKTILSLLATFFLLINPIYSQQYKFNKSFVETLKTGALKPSAVENLTIANLDRDEILLQSP